MKRTFHLRRLLGTLCVAGTVASGHVAAQKIVAISSDDTAPYSLAMSGLARLNVSVERFQLPADAERAIAAAISRGGRGTAVVAFGAAAAAIAGNVAKDTTTGLPVVNCMILDATPASAASINVPLEIPMDTQAAWIQRLLPRARTVGILFDPARNELRASESAAAMKRAGLVVLSEPVPNPPALPVALQRMQNHVDVVQALADPTVYAPEHARALLLFSFRHQIPLVGPTESWVRAGALFALDWDYADLGRYCGALALRQLAGVKTPPPPPPRTRVVANGRSAEQLRIHWDAQTLQLIDRVY